MIKHKDIKLAIPVFRRTKKNKFLMDIIKKRVTNLVVLGKGKHISSVEDIKGEQWISIRELEKYL